MQIYSHKYELFTITMRFTFSNKKVKEFMFSHIGR